MKEDSKKRTPLAERLKRLLSTPGAKSFSVLGLGSLLSSSIRSVGEGGPSGIGAIDIPLPAKDGEGRVFRVTKGNRKPLKKEVALPISQSIYEITDLKGAREFSQSHWGHPEFPDKSVDLARAASTVKEFQSEIDASEAGRRVIGNLNPIEKTYPDMIRAQSLQTPEAREKFKELTDTLEAFSKEKGLAETGLKYRLMAPSAKTVPGYDPIRHTVSVHRNSPNLALQQAAKASDVRGSVAKSYLRSVPLLGAALGVPFAMANAKTVEEANPDGLDAKVLAFMKDHPALVGASGYGASVVYPEAKASYIALQHLAKTKGKDAAMRALKEFYAPHVGKYMLGAAPVALSFAALKKFLGNQSQEKKASAGFTFSPSPLSKQELNKFFWKGFTEASVPSFLALSYLHGTKGGKAIQEEKGKKPSGLFKDHPYLTSAGAAAVIGGLAGALSHRSHAKKGI